MPDVIATHGLTKYYDAHCAVDHLNLRVPQGTVYGLLGRNGAGKTTTIKMLLGMAHPSFGRAEVLGEDSMHLRPRLPRPGHEGDGNLRVMRKTVISIASARATR